MNLLSATCQPGTEDPMVPMAAQLPQAMSAENGIWCACARPQGDACHTMVVSSDKQVDQRASLALRRPQGAPPVDENGRGEMADIARHGCAALRLGQRLERASLREMVTAVLLDRHPHGALVVDAAGRMIYANRAAERLAAQAGLTFSARNGIAGNCQADTASLQRLVQQACAGRTSGNLRFRGKNGDLRLAATVAPLPVSLHAQTQDAQPPRPGFALVTLCDLAPPAAPDKRRAMDIFRLTEAEAALLPPLMAGDTTEAIAGARNVSHHTVRTQVRSILAKTNTANLRALSALLAGLSNV